MTIEEDYLDRFGEVAKGLGLSALIADKIANFIHYEMRVAKKNAKKAGITAGLSKAESLVPEEKKDYFANSVTKYILKGHNSCRSSILEAIKLEKEKL